MHAGLAVHAKLQAEVIQVAEVAVATPEDAWGLKLLNTIQGVHQLLSEGMTRELYIFGSLQVQKTPHSGTILRPQLLCCVCDSSENLCRAAPARCMSGGSSTNSS